MQNELSREMNRASNEVTRLNIQLGHAREFITLATSIREHNIKMGWNVLQQEEWGNRQKISTVVFLIISEWAEALEVFRDQNLPPDTFHAKHKQLDPLRAYGWELADIAIRILDSIGSWLCEECPKDKSDKRTYKITANEEYAWLFVKGMSGQEIPKQVAQYEPLYWDSDPYILPSELTSWICLFNQLYLDSFVHGPDNYLKTCGQIYWVVLHHADVLGMDLRELIDEKMEYNRSRPHRHGRKTV